MALYTSYYSRQLDLRPESLQPEQHNVEGEKTVQKSVARRTVDITGPFLAWHERRSLWRNPADAPGLQATPAAALGLLPPVAYAHQPATSFNIKLAAQTPSKTRSSVNVALWTPDGRRCLTGTQAGEFCMWGGQSFQFETILQALTAPVRSMVFTHSGNHLVTGDDSGSVHIFRPNLELLKKVAAHRESVRQLAFAPSDLKFATASDDSTLRVWDYARVATEQVLAGHGGDVKTVDWHPRKALLVSGSKDALVKLWCARSGRAVGTMHGHKATVTATQWNANGNWVLTAGRDQVCKVFDIRMQAELASFKGQNKDITQAAWHPMHEALFVSGGHDGSLCFWLVGRAAPQAEVRGAHEGSVWAMAWHPAGHLLITGAGDAATKFWCRSRPGDPFFEHQQRAQAELAAMQDGDLQAAAPPRAPAPRLFAPPPSVAGAAAAIPGIGEGVAPGQAAAPVDVWAAAAAPSERARSAAGAHHGREPAPGGWQEREGGEDGRRRAKRERDRSPPAGLEREREQRERERRRSPPHPRRRDPERDVRAGLERREESAPEPAPRFSQPPPQYPQPQYPQPQYPQPQYPQQPLPQPQYPQQQYQQQPQPSHYAPPLDQRYGGPPQYGAPQMQPQPQPYGPPPYQQPYPMAPPAAYAAHPPPRGYDAPHPQHPPLYGAPPQQQPPPYRGNDYPAGHPYR